MTPRGWSAAALVLLVASVMQITAITDNDLWWLLKSGEHMVAARSLATTDPFTWTAQGRPWLNHTWGFSLVLYAIYRVAGFGGLGILQALFALATFGVVLWTLRRDQVPLPWALTLIAVIALITRGFWAPRPQIVTYLALAILCAAIREYRTGRADRLAWLPLLFLLWVNLHGGFAAGLGVLLLTALGHTADRWLGRAEGGAPGAGRLWLTLLGSLLAALVNPFHVHVLLFPLHVSLDRGAKDFIIEWSSPAFQHPELRLFESVLLFLLVALPAARRRLSLVELGLLVAFLHLTLDATRTIPLFLIVLAPLMGRLGGELGARARTFVAAAGGVLTHRVVILTALALIGLGGWFRGVLVRLPSSIVPSFGVADVFPERAVTYLLDHRVPGPFFNDYGWGGYLIWRLYPVYRVFIDGRMAIFPQAVRDDFIKVNNGEAGWQEVLERRGIRVALVRSGTALAALLANSGAWTITYQDAQAVVFERRDQARP